MSYPGGDFGVAQGDYGKEIAIWNYSSLNYCINVELRENILVLRKYTLQYCGVHGHDICTLLSNVQEKKCIYGENDKANIAKCQVLVNLAKGIQFFVIILVPFL